MLSKRRKKNLVGIIHRQGAAIDGHERAAPADTAAANGARQRLLAAAGFSLNQKRRIQRRSPTRQNPDPLHLGALDRHVGKRQMSLQRGTRAADFLRQRIDLQHIGNGNLNALEGDRLGHEVDRTHFHGLENRLEIIVLDENYHRHAVSGFTHAPQNGQAIHIRHGKIEQHQHNVLALADEAECAGPAICQDGPIAHAHDYRFQIASLDRIVIRYENARGH